jgi:hypothetical protein
MTAGAGDRVVAREALVIEEPAAKANARRRRRIRERGEIDLCAKRARR